MTSQQVMTVRVPPQAPEAFDWVEARAAAESLATRQTLFDQIEEDVRRRNSQLPSAPARFGAGLVDQSLRVVDRFGRQDHPRAVVFTPLRSGRLLVEDVDRREHELIPVVSSSGRVMWKLGDEELHPWQVSMRFLEPLLFPPES